MYTCSSIVLCHMYFKYIKEFYSSTCILSHLLTNKRATMTPLTLLGGDDGLNCTNGTSNHVKSKKTHFMFVRLTRMSSIKRRADATETAIGLFVDQ